MTPVVDPIHFQNQSGSFAIRGAGQKAIRKATQAIDGQSALLCQPGHVSQVQVDLVVSTHIIFIQA